MSDTVYVLFSHEPYEPRDFIGIFSTIAGAQDWATEIDGHPITWTKRQFEDWEGYVDADFEWEIEFQPLR